MRVCLPRLLTLGALAWLPSLLVAQSPAAPLSDADELMALLNTPISGASKRTQRLMDSPQAIEVLTGDEIRQMGIYRLQDALKLMTSVDLIEADGGFSSIGLRGVMQDGQPRTVQVLIDGVPLYNTYAGNIDLNNLPVPIDAVERVEIVRGPSSTLYGANAVVGVIAITTKRAGQGVHGSARYAHADKATHRGAASLLAGAGKWGLLASYGGASLGASGFATHKVGVPAIPVTYDAKHPDSSHQSQAFVRTDWTGDKASFWLSAGDAKKNLGPEALQRLSYRVFQVQTLSAGWKQAWSPAFSTEVRGHRVGQAMSVSPSPYLAGAFQDPRFLGEYKFGDLTTTQVEVQANWTPMDHVFVLFGADTRTVVAKAPVKFLGLLEDAKESASGGFLALDWELSERVTVSAGLRAENETLGGARVAPRLALIWKPGTATVLRAGYYTSSRSPQIMESRVNFSNPTGTALPAPYPPLPIVFQIRPNLGLKAEKTTNLEVGLRQAFGSVTLDLTLFAMKFSQLMTQVTLPVEPHPTYATVPTQWQNGGSATNNGVEAALTWTVSRSLSLGLNATSIAYTKDDPAPTDPMGKDFAYAPRQHANAWARFQQGAFSGYLGLQHVGACKAEALQTLGSPLYEDRAAFTQVHANLAVELFAGFQVGAYVRNGAREFTLQGASGPDRPANFQAARREMGASVSYRF